MGLKIYNRITRQRQAIIAELSREKCHPTADEVFFKVRNRVPNISLGTVYRNLEMLREEGLVKIIENAGEPRRFDINTNPHHHIKCIVCHRIDDIPVNIDIIDVIREFNIGEYVDYEITGCDIVFWGICSRCQISKAKSSMENPSSSEPRDNKITPASKGKIILNQLYAQYNKRKYADQDPIIFLYAYDDPRDREIIGLIASSLAYGNVNQILKNVSFVIDNIGHPRKFIEVSSPSLIRQKFVSFKHRFTTGVELSNLLLNIKAVLKVWGSLEKCFMSGYEAKHSNILPALTRFVSNLQADSSFICNTLIPCPELGSPCKRLNLFLRWMIRQDEVDPGGWYDIPPAKLIVPLDVHMHRLSLKMGFTSRKASDMRTAVEITESLKKFDPDDPVKYDFAITRLGIRNDLDSSTIIQGLTNALLQE